MSNNLQAFRATKGRDEESIFLSYFPKRFQTTKVSDISSRYDPHDIEDGKEAVINRLYYSPYEEDRDLALDWLDCFGTLDKSYRDTFKEPVPGYAYSIVELGQGEFVCLSRNLKYISPLLENIYVFINSLEPDKLFYASLRMLSTFIGRSTMKGSDLALKFLEPIVILSDISRNPKAISNQYLLSIDIPNTILGISSKSNEDNINIAKENITEYIVADTTIVDSLNREQVTNVSKSELQAKTVTTFVETEIKLNNLPEIKIEEIKEEIIQELSESNKPRNESNKPRNESNKPRNESNLPKNLSHLEDELDKVTEWMMESLKEDLSAENFALVNTPEHRILLKQSLAISVTAKQEMDDAAITAWYATPTSTKSADTLYFPPPSILNEDVKTSANSENMRKNVAPSNAVIKLEEVARLSNGVGLGNGVGRPNVGPGNAVIKLEEVAHLSNGVGLGNGVARPNVGPGNGVATPSVGPGNGVARPNVGPGNGVATPSVGPGNGVARPASNYFSHAEPVRKTMASNVFSHAEPIRETMASNIFSHVEPIRKTMASNFFRHDVPNSNPKLQSVIVPSANRFGHPSAIPAPNLFKQNKNGSFWVGGTRKNKRSQKRSFRKTLKLRGGGFLNFVSSAAMSVLSAGYSVASSLYMIGSVIFSPVVGLAVYIRNFFAGDHYRQHYRPGEENRAKMFDIAAKKAEPLQKGEYLKARSEFTAFINASNKAEERNEGAVVNAKLLHKLTPGASYFSPLIKNLSDKDGNVDLNNIGLTPVAKRTVMWMATTGIGYVGAIAAGVGTVALYTGAGAATLGVVLTSTPVIAVGIAAVLAAGVLQALTVKNSLDVFRSTAEYKFSESVVKDIEITKEGKVHTSNGNVAISSTNPENMAKLDRFIQARINSANQTELGRVPEREKKIILNRQHVVGAAFAGVVAVASGVVAASYAAAAAGVGVAAGERAIGYSSVLSADGNIYGKMPILNDIKKYVPDPQFQALIKFATYGKNHTENNWKTIDDIFKMHGTAGSMSPDKILKELIYARYHVADPNKIDDEQLQTALGIFQIHFMSNNCKKQNDIVIKSVQYTLWDTMEDQEKSHPNILQKIKKMTGDQSLSEYSFVNTIWYKIEFDGAKPASELTTDCKFSYFPIPITLSKIENTIFPIIQFNKYNETQVSAFYKETKNYPYSGVLDLRNCDSNEYIILKWLKSFENSLKILRPSSEEVKVDLGGGSRTRHMRRHLRKGRPSRRFRRSH